MKIGFIGNFIPPFSTENERKYSFEQLGHEVITFQENRTSAQQLIASMRTLDMLVYSHTHDPSYIIRNLKQVFAHYKKHGVPTVSVHLDTWVGLNRVKDVGKEATWFTEYIFMADGSKEAAAVYDKLGLNWHYLPPGVVERECYMAEPSYVKYPHEVVFTGSKNYHHEYEYRRTLIDFLYNTYGKKFAHYGNDGLGVVRQGALNSLYASAKIVIGDSCFGGKENYVSDRLTEVVGRGGFIITPNTETLGLPVATYNYPDLQDLKTQIDYWLEHSVERKALQKECHEIVKKDHTYTNRAEKILEVVFK
jgi:hypothetical protein